MSLRVKLHGDRNKAVKFLSSGKRFLDILKNAMSFQNLKQLSRKYVFEDGTSVFVQSVFGQDLIQINTIPVEALAEVIIEEGVYLIFLIGSSNEYAAWKIGDHGARLWVKITDVTKHITYLPTLVSMYPFPSTVKSNTNKNQHFIKVEQQYSNIITPRYGKRSEYYPSSGFDILFGIRNCYLPKGWEKGSEYEWDEAFTYYTYSNDYICSGRQNWYWDGNLLIKNLEVWKVNNNTIRIEYDNKYGHQLGQSFTAGAFEYQNDTFAVISKDKIVGVDWANAVNTSETIIEDHPWTDCWGPVAGSDYTVFSEGINGEPYKFGDILLHYHGYHSLGTKSGFYTTPTGCAGVTPPCEPAAETMTYSYQSKRQNSGVIKPLDYDNIDIDKTFIHIFAVSSVNSNEAKYVVTEWFSTVSGYGSTANGWIETGDSKEYIIAYRINGGSLQKITAAKLFNGDYTVANQSPIYGTPDGYDCPENTGTADNSTTVSGFQGQRIVYPSCQISPPYIFYTYVLQDYTGPLGEDHFDDEADSSNYAFNKRILGIIHIDTGKRTEHVVNNALLGDLYKNTFDEEKASAVGLHILRETSEETQEEEVII